MVSTSSQTLAEGHSHGHSHGHGDDCEAVGDLGVQGPCLKGALGRQAKILF